MVINDNSKIDNIDNYIKIIEIESELGVSCNLDNKIKNNCSNDNYYVVPIKDKLLSDIGVVYLGFTCYLNAILQILYHLDLFKEAILRLDVNDEDNNVLNELIILFDGLITKKSLYYNPISFINNFDNVIINVNEQKDAHEFLLILLNKLDLRLKNTNNANLIKYFFGSTITQTIYFKYNCKHKQKTTLYYKTLELDIGHYNCLIDSLNAFFQDELLEKDNMVECDKCKTKFASIKNFKIFNLPRNLIITLKRFEFNRDLNIKLKLNKYFEFPNILYLNRYMIPSIVNDNKFNDNYKYILKSIVIHKGNTENGHYWSIIRDAKSEKWIKFDDTNIKEISVLHVKKILLV
jgi:ubiquitin C-terminal hydrolase